MPVLHTPCLVSFLFSFCVQAGKADDLLGMTERMCLVLGLHVESPGVPQSEQAIRRRVW